MNIAGASRATATPLDSIGVSDSSSCDDASATRFAAMLAGAIDSKPAVRAVASTQAGTSELDDNDSAQEADDSSESMLKKTSAHPGTLEATVAAVSLGTPALGLNSELKARLARVVSRMKSEFGVDVNVAEGVRSQSRQNALFAQGRTAAGPVVTWTRNSLHTKGLAADLMIDGGYGDQKGFAELQQVAREEGLSTLGARDPGHVELRGVASGRIESVLDGISSLIQRGADGSAPAGSAPASASDLIAPPVVSARVLSSAVAQPARVATAARVATVATVAQMSSGAAGVSARNASANTDPRSGESRNGKDRSSARASLAAASARDLASADVSAIGERAYGAFEPANTRIASDAPIANVAQTTATVDRVVDLQDSQGARSISHLSLGLDDGRGGQDTVRIGMRGTSVGASFDIRDAGGADRVASRLGELSRALERRGLEPQTFQVRTTGGADSDLRSVRVGGAVQPASNSNSAARNDQDNARGDARHGFTRQDDQQGRSRERSDDRRRRDSIFSLTNEGA